MQFHEFTSAYQWLKREKKVHRSKKPLVPVLDWYPMAIRDLLSNPQKILKSGCRPEDASVALMGFQGEHRWYEAGQPYYKIFPAMAQMMSEVSIDIPPDVLRMPYPAFSIQLADDESNTITLCGERVVSLLVYRYELKTAPITIQSGVGASHYFCVAYQTNSARRHIEEGRAFMLGIRDDDPTIDFALQRSHGFSVDRDDPESQTAIIRLAIACCFFGIDKHEVVLPDLPRKVIEKRMRERCIREGEAIQQLAEEIKEQEQDDKKWTVGREISLPYPLVRGGNTTTPAVGTTGRERQFAYITRGHMRWQPYGEGRKQRKLIFIHPHMNKADMPLPPADAQRRVGYKIPNPSET